LNGHDIDFIGAMELNFTFEGSFHITYFFVRTFAVRFSEGKHT